MERPIILKAHEVRGILDGRQTQLRRIMKLQPENEPEWAGGWNIHSKHISVAVDVFNQMRGKMLRNDPTPCPYGKPGDRLWGRETWNDNWCDEVLYRATIGGTAREAGYSREPVWRPSSQMPRQRSRILLEIVSVRVERLIDISEEDCVAEGIEGRTIGDTMEGDYQEFWRDYLKPTSFMEGEDGEDVEVENHFYMPSESYQSLWESINGKGSWDASPWVWVVEFKQVDVA